ncbi:MAG: hypothetical protein H6834_06480 [Planctomycetes bacterium]|nr:hypothetical protein [Planctomycetota bacterium]
MRWNTPLLVLVTSIPLACSPDPGKPLSDSTHRAETQDGHEEEPEGTMAHEAFRWRRLRWLEEDGSLDPDGLARAVAQRERNLQAWATQGQLDGGGVHHDRWIERGPWNIGGRTRSLVIHPTQPSRLWAGSVGGGIWSSTDSGTTWTHASDVLPNLAICSLAIDPQDPNTLYAGTGEGYFNGDALRGAGIYRSTDGGATWARLPSTASFDNVCRIAISPVNSNLILIAKRYGGILRSTDGGQTWSTRLSAQGSFQVLFDPNDPQRMVAHVIDHDGQWFHRVVTSTDAGLTWSTPTSGLARVNDFGSRIELAYAKSQPNWVYASCGANAGEVWRSTDGGRTWTLRGSGTGVGWYYDALWVDPTNANFLLVGSYHIRKSTNGGSSFTQISNGYINTTQVHPDVHLFVEDPLFDGVTNRRVYVTCDGGIYRTNDIRNASQSSGWQRLEQSYRTTQFYGAAGDGASGRIVGGTQDNGTLRLNAGNQIAALTFGGDGGFCAIDWTNPNYLYGEYINLQIHRSTNGGSSASYIHQGIADAGNAANFIAPFILDPNDAARMLAGGASLWRTNNVRASNVSWSAIKPAIGSNISAIAVAPGNANHVWVAHNDGRLYRTTNGTIASPTWTALDDNGATDPLPDRYLTRILVDPSSALTAYAAFGGFSPDNLWKTTDGGLTWRDVTGTGTTGLPDAPINGIARHPLDAAVLYVGTEVGIFTSSDGGDHWATTNDGPGNISVDELTFLHGSTTLLAATHGRGLFTQDTHLPTVTSFGSGCAGSAGTPLLTPSPGFPPAIGAQFRMLASNLPSNRQMIAWLGFSNTTWNGIGLPLDLTFLGMPACTALVALDIPFPVPTLIGTTGFGIDIPDEPAAVGLTLYVQALVQDPTANAFGFTVSNGLEATLGF